MMINNDLDEEVNRALTCLMVRNYLGLVFTLQETQLMRHDACSPSDDEVE
jgi:hypothetical protein